MLIAIAAESEICEISWIFRISTMISPIAPVKSCPRTDSSILIQYISTVIQYAREACPCTILYIFEYERVVPNMHKGKLLEKNLNASKPFKHAKRLRWEH